MNDTTSDYIHGSSPEEQRRLSLLNELLNEACLRELGLQSGERVLDVGSGLGQFSRLMARTLGERGQVVGVEREQQQIAQAASFADPAGEAALVDFRQGDALDLPLRDAEWGTFDVVHARFLLEHVSEPEQVIEQMVRALRPGGRVIVIDDDHGDFRPFPEPERFQDLWQAYVRTFERLGNDPYIGRRLVSLLQQSGLTSLHNGGVFFGGCAGEDRFLAVADNLISAFEGAKQAMLSDGLLDENGFQTGIEGLHHWKRQPSSALWYSACCAKGVLAH